MRVFPTHVGVFPVWLGTIDKFAVFPTHVGVFLAMIQIPMK